MTHRNAPMTVEGRHRMVALVVDEGWSQRRVAERFQVSPATVSRWVHRHRTGARLQDRSSRPHRSRHRLDKRRERRIIALRSPDGGGWRAHGRSSTQALAADRKKTAAKKQGRPADGHRYLHHAVDDHSRTVYSEILDDEKKHTAAGFWNRANAFFDGLGVTVEAVMTDNGSCYRSSDFKKALGPQIKHKRTRPRRPQTNGKPSGSTGP